MILTMAAYAFAPQSLFQSQDLLDCALGNCDDRACRIACRHPREDRCVNHEQVVSLVMEICSQ
jgi:hypothetical protein